MATTTTTIWNAATTAGWAAVGDTYGADRFARGQDTIYVTYNSRGHVDGVSVNGHDHPHNVASVALGAFKHVRTGA